MKICDLINTVKVVVIDTLQAVVPGGAGGGAAARGGGWLVAGGAIATQILYVRTGIKLNKLTSP